MSFNLNVILLDNETGEIHEHTIDIPANEKISRIRELLAVRNSVSLKLYQQCREVRGEETVGEVFESGDTVTIFKEEEGVKRSGKGLNMRNNSTEEIRVVILNLLKEEPIFIPGGLVKTVRFGLSNLSNKLEIYRKVQGEDRNGESIYKGERYKLPTDQSVLQYYIDNNGLYMAIKNTKDPVLIQPLPADGEEMIKYERDFHKPIRTKFKMTVENTGEDPLCVVSGMSSSFDISPVINGGTETKITIRSSQITGGKFLFGPFSKEDILNFNQVRACMFDAREVMNGMKIQICKTKQGQVRAAMVLTDAKDPQKLVSTGTLHYRDEDRITKKKFLEWILPNAVTAVGAIAGAFTGA